MNQPYNLFNNINSDSSSSGKKRNVTNSKVNFYNPSNSEVNSRTIAPNTNLQNKSSEASFESNKNLQVRTYSNDQDLNMNCEMPNPKTNLNSNDWQFYSRNFNREEQLGLNSNNPNFHGSTLQNFQHRNMSSILSHSNQECFFVEQPSSFPKSNVGFFNKNSNMNFTLPNTNGCFSDDFYPKSGLFPQRMNFAHNINNPSCESEAQKAKQGNWNKFGPGNKIFQGISAKTHITNQGFTNNIAPNIHESIANLNQQNYESEKMKTQINNATNSENMFPDNQFFPNSRNPNSLKALEESQDTSISHLLKENARLNTKIFELEKICKYLLEEIHSVRMSNSDLARSHSDLSDRFDASQQEILMLKEKVWRITSSSNIQRFLSMLYPKDYLNPFAMKQNLTDLLTRISNHIVNPEKEFLIPQDTPTEFTHIWDLLIANLKSLRTALLTPNQNLRTVEEEITQFFKGDPFYLNVFDEFIPAFPRESRLFYFYVSMRETMNNAMIIENN